jgi:hypothetical protein
VRGLFQGRGGTPVSTRHTGSAGPGARTRATDRASLAAGVVLGAGTAVAVSAVRGLVRRDG